MFKIRTYINSSDTELENRGIHIAFQFDCVCGSDVPLTIFVWYFLDTTKTGNFSNEYTGNSRFVRIY